MSERATGRVMILVIESLLVIQLYCHEMHLWYYIWGIYCHSMAKALAKIVARRFALYNQSQSQHILEGTLSPGCTNRLRSVALKTTLVSSWLRGPGSRGALTSDRSLRLPTYRDRRTPVDNTVQNWGFPHLMTIIQIPVVCNVAESQKLFRIFRIKQCPLLEDQWREPCCQFAAGSSASLAPKCPTTTKDDSCI